MITLIHGEDITASRNFYFELKKNSAEQVTLDGTIISATDLQQALSGSDLFGESKQIFIENLLSKRKGSKELDSLISLVQSSIINNNSSIVLWESKELTPKQVAQFSKATVRLFKIPSTIFAFLDGIRPSNGKQLIELFHKTMEDKDPEFVLVMLQRQVRILLALSSGHSGTKQSEVIESQRKIDPIATLQDDRMTISEVSRIQPWQKGKLEKQSSLFIAEQLVSLHNKLFELELGMKTGGLTLPLAESIDLLLLSI